MVRPTAPNPVDYRTSRRLLHHHPALLPAHRTTLPLPTLGLRPRHRLPLEPSSTSHLRMTSPTLNLTETHPVNRRSLATTPSPLPLPSRLPPPLDSSPLRAHRAASSLCKALQLLLLRPLNSQTGPSKNCEPTLFPSTKFECNDVDLTKVAEPPQPLYSTIYTILKGLSHHI